MPGQSIDNPLAAVTEAELTRLSRVAGRLLAGRPSFTSGLQHNRNRAGPGTEFLDFREYSSGDDLRHIDWRVTARSGRPYIRRYHDELSADWYICLDRSASMHLPDTGKWALAVQLTAALAHLLLQLGNRVGVMQFSEGIDRICPLGRGHAQYLNITSQLRTGSPHPNGGDSILINCARALRHHWHVIVISDFLRTDGMQPDLRFLRSTGREVQAVQVLSDNEVTLAAEGAHTLQDVESGTHMNISLPCEASAQACLRRLIDELGSFCRSQHIRFSSCNTHQRWADVLVQHLTDLPRD